MVCDILDGRCIFVNELVGNADLTLVLFVIVFAIVASKLQFRFRTSIFLFVPIFLILGLAISSFTTILIVTTMVVGLFASWVVQRIIKN